MKEIYSVRYKRGDVEFDIESSDKDYIDKKLAEMQIFSPAALGDDGRSKIRARRTKPTARESNQSAEIGQVSDSVLVQIVASINDAEKYDQIAKYVLDRSARPARILMCFYFAQQHATQPALTTTEVERITSQLGIKIAAPNVAKVIRQGTGKYLTADRVRRKGVPVRYQINRRGIAAFEQIIANEGAAV